MYGNLNSLINFLEEGTKLHICMIFFRDYNNENLKLSYERKIHVSDICDYFKVTNYKDCLKCRNCAVNKAILTQKSFGGLCFNGLYEYMRPVLINKKCVAVICIGNILSDRGRKVLEEKLGDKEYLISTAENNYDQEKCKNLADVIEGYFRLIVEKHSLDKDIDSDSVIDNIILYIKGSSQYDIKLSYIAECFHYNEQYLGRLFKKKTGKTYNEYLNSVRIDEAKHLLIKTKEPIIDIALKVGFNNVTYFNRIFKILTHFTPSEFREKKKAVL